jgi:hypothetical protein
MPAAVIFSSAQPAAVVDQSLRQSPRRSLAALDHARECAVLWFAEVMRRRLYLELGYSSINQDAMQALGFSRSRCGHFVQLARKLDQLPADRAELLLEALAALAEEKEGAPRGAGAAAGRCRAAAPSAGVIRPSLPRAALLATLARLSRPA